MILVKSEVVPSLNIMGNLSEDEEAAVCRYLNYFPNFHDIIFYIFIQQTWYFRRPSHFQGDLSKVQFVRKYFWCGSLDWHTLYCISPDIWIGVYFHACVHALIYNLQSLWDKRYWFIRFWQRQAICMSLTVINIPNISCLQDQPDKRGLNNRVSKPPRPLGKDSHLQRRGAGLWWSSCCPRVSPGVWGPEEHSRC